MSIAFVTGANSFLGSTLIRHLLDSGRQVRGLLRPNANDILLAGLPVERIRGDLLQPSSYHDALSNCDELYHVAASYTQVPAERAQMEEINVIGTRLVLEAALSAGVPRLLHTSTIGTIGQPKDGRLAHEDMPFNLADPSPYVRSKLAGESIALELAQQGRHVVIVHPTAMLGPGDWRPSASGRRVLDFLQGRMPSYATGGINWCPVHDVALGMILALERGRSGRRYILGHHRGNLDRDSFLALLSQASGIPIPGSPRSGLRTRAKALLRWSSRSATPQGVDPSPKGSAAPERLTCDPARAMTELDMPQSDLLMAARQQIAWYREQGYV